MNGSDEAGRISRLFAALGRITASLEPETVLTEVVEGARARSVNAGRVVTRDALLRRVWSRREDATVQAVRNFVKKLHRKLGDDPAQPAFIHNVRGVGYKMPKTR